MDRFEDRFEMYEMVRNFVESRGSLGPDNLDELMRLLNVRENEFEEKLNNLVRMGHLEIRIIRIRKGQDPHLCLARI